MNTKEKIMIQSLHLFAQNGYEAVSVKDIADKLGITKGALYRHYANKRDIFNHIVNKMKQNDFERSQDFGVPEGSFAEMEKVYHETVFEKIKDFSIAQFRYWTEDSFASDFRKLLILEQYRDSEMSKLYQQYLVSGVVGYMEDLFREMKGYKIEDPRQFAIDFYAPIYIAMSIYDGTNDKEEAISIVEKHIDRFSKIIRNMSE